MALFLIPTKQTKEEWLPEDGGMVTSEDAFTKLHRTSFKNRELLKLDRSFSCFYCFLSSSTLIIEEWTDEGQTAICPKCHIDSVLAGEIDQPLLAEMHKRYFTVLK
jgi:hypothetical protein